MAAPCMDRRTSPSRAAGGFVESGAALLSAVEVVAAANVAGGTAPEDQRDASAAPRLYGMGVAASTSRALHGERASLEPL